MQPYNTPNFENLYRPILEELFDHDWSQPVQAFVEELGLAMGSHIGLKRNRNEDRVIVARIQAPNAEIYTVALVCDGVGGSEAGDQAATFAIAAVLFELCAQRSKASISDIADYLVRCADNYVRQQLSGRGTTTLSMFISNSSGHSACVSIGDSRVYSWEPTNEVRQLTTDDTVENELKALPGDHEALIKARGLKGRLSQAIGESGRTAEEIRVQVIPHERFRSGVLLGSDGLWKIAKDFDSVMLNSRTAIDAVRRGINLANWVGGLDNASIIVIEDLNKFSKAKAPEAVIQSTVSVLLWMGNSKFKFIIDSPPNWRSKSAKSDNAGRRPTKPKKAEYKDSQSQLEIPETKNTSKGQKLAIEVTLGSEPLSKDGK